MNNESYITNRPFEATNKKPYIFISYKHDDWEEVYPIINRFHEVGYNIWYDAALTQGQNYDIEIANEIKNSDLFITFLTDKVMERANDQEDYLVKELAVAIKKKRPRMFIYLESVGPDDLEGYYLMNCNGIQSMVKNDYGDDDDMFINQCLMSFKYHFKIEPNAVDEDLQDENLEIAENQVEEVDVSEIASANPMSKMDKLSEEVNSLSDVCQDYEDIVDRISDRIYGLYEDNARRYLADAYGMVLEHTYLDSEILYNKYGPQADSFENRLGNLKQEMPEMRIEVINRIQGLNSIGYEIADKNDERKSVTKFSDSEETELARYNHYVWCKSKIMDNKQYGYDGVGAKYLIGVTLGSVGSDIDLLPPFRDSLVLWDDLSNYEKNENIDFVNRIFEYLPSDLKIVKVKNIKPKSHLKELIESGVKEIVLDSDIVFDTQDSQDIKIFDDNLIIDGDGHTIDANKKSRIFTIRGKNITIKNLTFKNGLTDRNGGAVFVHQNASCSFINCRFIKNTSSLHHLKANTEGGAIYNEGSCRLDLCVFEQNMSDEYSYSKDIAPFESFELNDCTFDENAGDVSQPQSKLKPLDECEPVDSANTSLEGEAKMDVFGVKYSFRDPNSDIYKLAEKYYYSFKGELSEDFSKLSDEDYCSFELSAIRAICIVKAAGGVISLGKCKNTIDSKEIRHFKTIDKARKLFASKMKELGWNNGPYDFKTKTCSLYTGGGWAGDKEEEIFIRILDYVEMAGFSFCKVKNGVDIPVLQEFDKPDFNITKESIPTPYKGTEPYIYISYMHSDSKIVFSLINQLSDAGFNVWYDRGLDDGLDYDIQLANHIKNSSLFVSVLSENMMNSSPDDYPVKELHVASQQKIPCLPIYLEDVDLNGFYIMHYGTQPILKFKQNDEDFIKSCISTFKDFGVEPNSQKQEIPLNPSEYNFKYLDNLIRDNRQIVLKSDIVFNDPEYENGIEIKNDIVIDGGGHTIDACGKARIFNISAGHVVLKNINFINGFGQTGGALFVKHSAGLNINSCKFKNNHAEDDGGAIINNGITKISDSSFLTNDSEGFGGAIKNTGIAEMDIENCEFNANKGIDGAAIANYSKIDIFNTRFYQNEAFDSAGALANFNKCSIKGCDFLNNRSNSTIKGNGGGALYNYKGSLEIEYCKFEENYSNLGGGAIRNYEGDLRIDNSDFRKNTSNDKGNSIMNGEKASIMINNTYFDETLSNEIFSQGKIELNSNCKFKQKDIMPSKKDVFISYSTKDFQIADNIRNSGESKGVSCWIAPRDIVAKDNYDSQIMKGIENAEIFLVIYSQNYAQSNLLKKELEYAVKARKPIIAINTDKSDVEGEFKYLLSNAQWITEDTDIKNLDEAFKNKPEPKSEPKKKGLRSRLFGRR